MESRDALSGNYDLIVCDGFSGNVLVKTTEGTCIELLKMLKGQLTSSLGSKIGALFLKNTLKKIIVVYFLSLDLFIACEFFTFCTVACIFQVENGCKIC